jgi:hypothetical protein
MNAKQDTHVTIVLGVAELLLTLALATTHLSALVFLSFVLLARTALVIQMQLIVHLDTMQLRGRLLV